MNSCEDGRCEPLSEQREHRPCPVCSQSVPSDILDEHCQSRFEESAPQTPIAIEDEDEDIICPLGCGQTIPTSDYASHEAAHRLQEEEVERRSREEQRQFEALQAKYGMSEKRPGNCRRCGEEGHWAQQCPQNPDRVPARVRTVEAVPAVICAAQRPAPFHRVTPGLMQLLKQALAAQSTRFRAVLSGPVDHFQASSSDSGWGCGWRNIQMLSSHLLQRNPEIKAALFGGCGYVPDIGALQAWLEAAWAAGFDRSGAEQLGGAVQGSHKWVGTTEAAALLRFFGVRARVVDFRGNQGAKRARTSSSEDAPRSALGGGNEAVCTSATGEVIVHQSVACDICCACPIRGVCHKSQVVQDYDLCSRCRALPEAEAFGPFTEMRAAAPRAKSGALAALSGGAVDHSVLMRWVWQYYLGEGEAQLDGSRASGATAGELCAPSAQTCADAASSTGGGRGRSLLDALGGPVVLSRKPPLYFQHEGHSRTIVGVERVEGRGNAPPSVHLLVLDPSQATAPLERALRKKNGWQRLIKRSVGMLQKPEYQLLFCEDGLASGQELAELKIMRTTQNFGF